MGKILIIAEKPSVGADIAKALQVSGRKNGYIENEKYIVTWAVGHLIGLKYPEEHNPEFKQWKLEDLPFSFPLDQSLKVLPDTADQFQIVASLINRPYVDCLVNAGDSGREGLLIQEWIYRMAGNQKPIKMLWISSFTEEAVKKAFAQGLKERKDFLSLLDEAEARAEGDHLLGINYSRLLTLTKAERMTLSYGRCQTPLLHMIVARDEEIDHFRPTPYYNVSLTYGKGFKGILVDEAGKRIDLLGREEVEQLLAQLKDQATIVRYQEEEKAQKAPLLYNLAGLQKAMGIQYGYTPDQTLTIAQDLYEKHKILSYPRTDSQCLSTDLFHEIGEHLMCCHFGKYKTYIDRINMDAIEPQKRYFNDLKVTDHYALIPTIQKDMEERYQKLSEQERNVFDAVVSRFVAIFLPEYRYTATEIIAENAGHRFQSRGITIQSLGYKELLKAEEKEEEGVDREEKQILPKLSEGADITVDKKEILDRMTKAPARYTIAGLIAAMEKYNIGTSATRAEIVKKLLKRFFVTLENGKYYSTQLGRSFIQMIPDELKDVRLTERFESNLEQINLGTLTKQQFLGMLLEDVKRNMELFTREGTEANKLQREAHTLGNCPLCGQAVLESAKAYGCSGYKGGCNFVIWKTIAGKTILPQQAQQLLTNGCTAKLKGFTGKKGKFDAALVLKSDGTIGFQFENKNCKRRSW